MKKSQSTENSKRKSWKTKNSIKDFTDFTISIFSKITLTKNFKTYLKDSPWLQRKSWFNFLFQIRKLSSWQSWGSSVKLLPKHLVCRTWGRAGKFMIRQLSWSFEYRIGWVWFGIVEWEWVTLFPMIKFKFEVRFEEKKTSRGKCGNSA